MCGLSYLCTQAFGDAPEMRIRIVRTFFINVFFVLTTNYVENLKKEL